MSIDPWTIIASIFLAFGTIALAVAGIGLLYLVAILGQLVYIVQSANRLIQDLEGQAPALYRMAHDRESRVAKLDNIHYVAMKEQVERDRSYDQMSTARIKESGLREVTAIDDYRSDVSDESDTEN